MILTHLRYPAAVFALTLLGSACVAWADVDLFVVKTDGQRSYSPGEHLAYTIIVGNSGPDAAIGARVTDLFPAEIASARWECFASGGAACPASGTGDIDHLVDLPDGGSVVYAVDATVSVDAQAPELVNVATVSAPVGVSDRNHANNRNDDRDTLTASADLAITKTDGISVYTPGQGLTYILRVTNAGPLDAIGAQVEDFFPAALDNIAWGCQAGPGAACAPFGLGDIEEAVDVPAGSWVEFTATASVSESATVDPLVNGATVRPPTGLSDNDLSDNEAEDRDARIGGSGADLSVTAEVVGPSPQAGGFFTVCLSAANAGPSTATGTAVVVELPAGVELISATHDCEDDGEGLACDLGDLAADATASAQLLLHVGATAATAGGGGACDGGEDLCLAVSTTTSSLDFEPANDVAELGIDVVPGVGGASLSVTLEELAAEPLSPGDLVPFHLAVRNAGPATAEGVLVWLELDPLVSWSGPTPGCESLRPSLVRCAFGSLAAAEVVSVDLGLRISAAASTEGDATVACDGTEDVCTQAIAAASTGETEISDNIIGQATDLAAGLHCGDGNIDPDEDCDEPSEELCYDGTDDDGDGALDCFDSQCATNAAFGCSPICRAVAPCVSVVDFKGRLRLVDSQPGAAPGPDGLKMAGWLIPFTNVALDRESFRVTLFSGQTPAWSVELMPGDLQGDASAARPKLRFRDPGARDPATAVRGGLAKLVLRRGRLRGVAGWRFKLQAWGDFYAASVDEPRAFVYLGDDAFFATVGWRIDD